MRRVYHTVQNTTTYQLPLFTYQRCYKCDKEKFLDEFELRNDTNKYRSSCKECENQGKKKRRLDNIEHYKEVQKNYAINNTEKVREYKKEYYHAHRDQNREKVKIRQYTHREESKKYHKEYYTNHKNEIANKNREYRNIHQKRIKLQEKEKYITHRQEYIERARRREAIRRSVTVGVVSYKRILQRDGMHCYICDKAIRPEHRLHFDHVIPLVRNGAHSEENIKPTHALCNLRKHDTLPSELTPYQRRGVD